MKKYSLVLVVLLIVFSFHVYAGEEKSLHNVLESIPYTDGIMGKRKLVDEGYLLMMQAALKPGQSVPQHNANSNVHLLILKGELVVNLDGKDVNVKEGDLLKVVFKTPMNIKNNSDSNATFLIIKTPNPSDMK